MNYKMKVWITNPSTPKGMNSDLFFNLDCEFFYNPNDYGNGHHLFIKGKNFSPLSYDLRYDKSFNRNKKEKYLKEWANSYWNGQGFAYKVKNIEIVKM